MKKSFNEIKHPVGIGWLVVQLLMLCGYWALWSVIAYIHYMQTSCLLFAFIKYWF